MKLLITDYNYQESDLNPLLLSKTREMQLALERLPLHLKASDQKGKQGTPIFDPVGTNNAIKTAFVNLGWEPNVTIPAEYNFLGTDVDFSLQGIVAEVQFSNYPFLLNNLLRSELFYKSKILLPSNPLDLLVVITKAGMFPSSNSTLYYEQAQKQLSALSDGNVFDVPIRLIGLTSETGEVIAAKWTDYSSARYSRTVNKQSDIEVRVEIPLGQRRKAEIYRL
jgi:hypothetical protein